MKEFDIYKFLSSNYFLLVSLRILFSKIGRSCAYSFKINAEDLNYLSLNTKYQSFSLEARYRDNNSNNSIILEKYKIITIFSSKFHISSLDFVDNSLFIHLHVNTSLNIEFKVI